MSILADSRLSEPVLLLFQKLAATAIGWLVRKILITAQGEVFGKNCNCHYKIFLNLAVVLDTSDEKI